MAALKSDASYVALAIVRCRGGARSKQSCAAVQADARYRRRRSSAVAVIRTNLDGCLVAIGLVSRAPARRRKHRDGLSFECFAPGSPAVPSPVIEFTVKRSPATVSAVHDPRREALAAVPRTANGCDRESSHESVAVLFAPAA